VGVDLTDYLALERTLSHILESKDPRCWHILFIAEGVLIFLDDNVRVIHSMAEATRKQGSFSSSLCWADQVSSQVDHHSVRQELSAYGWELFDWYLKPGRANQMGCARVRRLERGGMKTY